MDVQEDQVGGVAFGQQEGCFEVDSSARDLQIGVFRHDLAQGGVDLLVGVHREAAQAPSQRRGFLLPLAWTAHLVTAAPRAA